MSWLDDLSKKINGWNVAKAVSPVLGGIAKEAYDTYKNSPISAMRPEQRKQAFSNTKVNFKPFSPAPNVGGDYNKKNINVYGNSRQITTKFPFIMNSPSSMMKTLTHEGAHSGFNSMRASSPRVTRLMGVDNPQRMRTDLEYRTHKQLDDEYLNNMPAYNVVMMNRFLKNSPVYKKGYDLPSELYAYSFTDDEFRKWARKQDNLKKYY